MSSKIGLLLPRSTEYPSISFDLHDGLKLGLRESGRTDIQIISDNTGFGEDISLTNSKCEKLILSDEVDLIVAYASSLNAEALYDLAKTSGRPFLFLDPGMEHFESPPSPFCRYLSLQGMQACYLIGQMASGPGKNVLAAASFYDGGYRGPKWIANGIAQAGGSVCGNYVTVYKAEEFTLQPFLQLLSQTSPDSVTACFSTYLMELFMKHLKENYPASTALPFYCTPFMAEEWWLEKTRFPGGTFHTIVPWGTSITNAEQQKMTDTILKQKNKKPNIFHLLGWEAAKVVPKILADGISSIDNWSFDSPRGVVTFHPETHNSYAPLYKGMIEEDENGFCRLAIQETIAPDAELHARAFLDKPDEQYSRWRNNYFCI